MRLWLLKPIDPDSGPWDPWWDKLFGAVVVAQTARQARAFAAKKGGYECLGKNFVRLPVTPWEDPGLTTCEELNPDHEAEGVVLVDFRQA